MHTVGSLAEYVGGRVLGDFNSREINGINDLRSAEPEQLSFLGNAKYKGQALASRAGAILVTAADAPGFVANGIQVDSPNAAFAKISELFAPLPILDEPGVHPTAVVASDAEIGEGASVQAYAVISRGVRIGARTAVGAHCFIGEGCTLGGGTRLFPHVTLRERCVIGSRVIIHSGAVIGADGFGYELRDGKHVKIPHSGFVQIDDDVEIGANTTIDRARFGRTHIAEGVKIDNLVQIAHNVAIGAHSIVVSQTGISGSTSLGKYVTLAGQVGLAGHLTVGDRAVITAQAGLNKDVAAGAVLSGHHAIPMRESLKLEALTRRLPELFARLKELEDKVRALS